MRSGELTRAEKEFRQDTAIEPDLPDTYEMLGEFYMREGRDPEAESSFQEALRKNSRMADSHFGIAKICFHQGKYQEALAEADAVLQIAPGGQGIHNLRGQILSKLGRKQEAQAEFARVNEADDARYSNEVETFREGRVPNPELTRQSPP